MIPDPPVRTFLVNAGRALDAAEVIANEDCRRALFSGGRGRRFKSSHSDQHASTFSAAYGGIGEKFEEGCFSAEALRKPAAENSIPLRPTTASPTSPA